MNEEFELNGRLYRWVNGVWLQAGEYISPPKVIQQELNRRYGDRVKSPQPSASARHNQRRQDGRIWTNLDPIILAFIQNRFKQTQTWVTRDEIVVHLQEHETVRPFLEERYNETAQKMSLAQYIGNQVDWLSARFTQDMTDFQHLLEQQEDEDGKKMYRPV